MLPAWISVGAYWVVTVTVVLVMSHHPDTSLRLRLSPDTRQLPCRLIETLRDGEDLSFRVDQ